jgi:acyl-CoA synthetase (AMP-forming)/AMP-acid ligase II
MDIIPNEKKLDIQALNRHFVDRGVTQAHLPTQIARLFIQEIADTSLRDLVCGGEKLGQVSVDRDYRITDTYGPTEACVYVTSIDLKEKIDPSSIGFVIGNTKAYVLDKERRRVPVGAVGELYLSGPQLADGYLNREEETARAFLPNPFEEGSGYYSTFYATGDVVRILPDGSYGFIGRRDSQVKIRGNRLELSEVEALIRKIDGVSDVTARIRKLDGNNELIVYVFYFGHYAFIKIIFLTELFSVVRILRGTENIEVSTEVSLNILETVMGLAGFHFFVRRKYERRVCTKEGSCNKCLIKNIRKAHNCFYDDTADARFQREFNHHLTDGRKGVVFFQGAENVKGINCADNSFAARVCNKIKIIKICNSKLCHSKNYFT